MLKRIQLFRRLWLKSPRLAFAWVRRTTQKDVRKLIPKDEWKIDWLGEEMRPFNSLMQRKESTPQ